MRLDVPAAQLSSKVRDYLTRRNGAAFCFSDHRPIELYVGTAKLHWQTGLAHVIDDTYPHSARHLGEHDEGDERCWQIIWKR